MVLALLAGTACAAFGHGSGNPKPAERESSAQKEPGARLTPREIADRSTRAVVSVRTEETLGTGFIVHQDGWIATNLHVVERGGKITVTFANGTQLPVIEVLNASREHDLAILRVDAKRLPVLTLGDSDGVRPGDTVVAIGHPLGLEDTVSNGLVSAVRRLEPELEVLQISAPIAPGSSGGPLFNEHGDVIGVATAILQGGQNLNLALPAKYVKELIEHPEPVSVAVFTTAMSASREPTPKVERHVPKYSLTLLKGCSPDALVSIVAALAQAAEVGAPLYNNGNFAGCYHVYEGAALDLSRRLPKTCVGPKRALSDGRQRAAKLNDPSRQAWALRDAFDGLMDVITRRLDQH